MEGGATSIPEAVDKRSDSDSKMTEESMNKQMNTDWFHLEKGNPLVNAEKMGGIWDYETLTLGTQSTNDCIMIIIRLKDLHYHQKLWMETLCHHFFEKKIQDMIT